MQGHPGRKLGSVGPAGVMCLGSNLGNHNPSSVLDKLALGGPWETWQAQQGKEVMGVTVAKQLVSLHRCSLLQLGPTPRGWAPTSQLDQVRQQSTGLWPQSYQVLKPGLKLIPACKPAFFTQCCAAQPREARAGWSRPWEEGTWAEEEAKAE